MKEVQAAISSVECSDEFYSGDGTFPCLAFTECTGSQYVIACHLGCTGLGVVATRCNAHH